MGALELLPRPRRGALPQRMWHGNKQNTLQFGVNTPPNTSENRRYISRYVQPTYNVRAYYALKRFTGELGAEQVQAPNTWDHGLLPAIESSSPPGPCPRAADAFAFPKSGVRPGPAVFSGTCTAPVKRF